MAPNSAPAFPDDEPTDRAPSWQEPPVAAMVSAQAVQAAVDASAYGEYGADHDWTPSCSLADKAQILASLLGNWQHTEPAGRSAILAFARALIAESRRYSQEPAAVLVEYSGLPEIQELVVCQLNSALFALGVLAAMQGQGRRCDPWLSRIAQHVCARTLVARKHEGNVNAIYREVAAGLAGFGVG